MLISTGIWRSKDDAKRGGSGPWHKQARDSAKDLYEQIVFTTLELVVDDGVGSWVFSNWSDG